MNNAVLKEYIKTLLSRDSDKPSEEKREVFHVICSVLKAKDEWEKAVDIIDEPIIIMDDNHVITRINKAAGYLLAMPLKEIIGQKYCDLICGSDSHEACVYKKNVKPGRFFAGEIDNFPFPGTFYVRAYSRVIDGLPRKILALRDITQEKIMATELALSEKKYRTIIDRAGEGILIAEISTKNFIYANSAICDMLGYTKEELETMRVADLHPEESLAYSIAEFKALAASNKRLAHSIPCRKKDGSILYTDIVGGSVEIDGKQCNIGFFTDITERKKLEDEINQSRWQMQSIVDCSANGVLIIKDIVITFANRAASKILGHPSDEMQGASFFEVFRLENGNRDDTILEKISEYTEYLEFDNSLEYNIRRKDGGTCWVNLKGVEIALDGDLALLVNIIDIQKMKETEFSLLQSEKLATIGQLASGVAHEINNPLAYIMSNMRSLAEYINIFTTNYGSVFNRFDSILNGDPPAGVRQQLEQIKAELEEENIGFLLADAGELLHDCLDGTQRIAQIVADIKSFSRMEKEEEKKPANINEIIQSALNIVWNQLKYTSEVKTQLAPDLPQIVCHSQQLTQIFINILVNASQAIQTKLQKSGQNTRGTISIISGLKSEKASTVEVIIKDDGCGIPDEVKPNIFNPFFTTKEADKGTGLGMSITLDIIKKHNGTITFESEEHKGTAFFIELPVYSGLEFHI